MKPETVQIVTTILAVYAAILATANFVVGRRDRKRIVKISIGNALIIDKQDRSRECVQIVLMNPAHHSVTIRQLFLCVGEGMFEELYEIPSIRMEGRLPFELKAGTSLIAMAPRDSVKKVLMDHNCAESTKIAFGCLDSLETIFRSKHVDFHLESASIVGNVIPSMQ